MDDINIKVNGFHNRLGNMLCFSALKSTRSDMAKLQQFM